jgi:hypothetical protein
MELNFIGNVFGGIECNNNMEMYLLGFKFMGVCSLIWELNNLNFMGLNFIRVLFPEY